MVEVRELSGWLGIAVFFSFGYSGWVRFLGILFISFLSSVLVFSRCRGSFFCSWVFVSV